jgi:hypothetical protein
MGLAVEFKRKSLTVLDDRHVVDRALETVIANLRERRGGSAVDRDQHHN